MRDESPMSRAAPSRLVSSGLAEIAGGALSGWVYTLARTQPELARRLGIRSAERVRQWHLDLAMLAAWRAPVHLHEISCSARRPSRSPKSLPSVQGHLR
jgi:hypothetical protein